MTLLATTLSHLHCNRRLWQQHAATRRSRLRTTASEPSIPADYTAECSDELILDDATATDNCGEVTIEVSSETTAGDCDGSYRLHARSPRRTTATAVCTQTITVEDTTAPEFTSVPANYRRAP